MTKNNRYDTGVEDRNGSKVYLGDSIKFVKNPGASWPISEGVVLKPFVSQQGNIVIKAFSMALSEFPADSFEVVDGKKE